MTALPLADWPFLYVLRPQSMRRNGLNTWEMWHFKGKKAEEECSSDGRWRFSSIPAKVSGKSLSLVPGRGTGETEWTKWT